MEEIRLLFQRVMTFDIGRVLRFKDKELYNFIIESILRMLLEVFDDWLLKEFSMVLLLKDFYDL